MKFQDHLGQQWEIAKEWDCTYSVLKITDTHKLRLGKGHTSFDSARQSLTRLGGEKLIEIED